MSELLDRIKKNSTIKEASLIEKSAVFNGQDIIQTPVPALNIALSGRIDGGLTAGVTIFAGPSKHFKSMFSLIMAKSYMDKHKDAVLMFYDNEFGTPISYFKSLGIDMSRVMHIPIENLEQLKFDIVTQLEGFTRKDKVIFIIDSIGNVASKKELDDTLEQKSTQDMTRSKQLKSFFRMVTPTLNIKDIPMICVAHVYKTLELYAKDVVSGGTGGTYAADNIFILGRQQEKEGTDVVGYNFIINVEKGRLTREKSKIPITVKFDGGLSKWSGLIDMALEAGAVVKPSNGWYSRVDLNTGEVEEKKYRLKETDTADFWQPILTHKLFTKWISDNYQVSNGSLLTEDVIEKELAGVSTDE